MRNWHRLGFALVALFVGCKSISPPASGDTPLDGASDDAMGDGPAADASCSEDPPPQGPQSELVFVGSDGNLTYVPDAKGNTIPDFSFAGYRGGGVALPMVDVKKELSPVASGDDRERIQAALDEVGDLPVSEAGFRGALLLRRGTYRLSAALVMNKSGVVLRGEGQGDDGTVLLATWREEREDHNRLIEVVGTGEPIEIRGQRESLDREVSALEG